ncbi:ATPase component of ABC transporter [Labilithrix luteola]|uniref:ATPase component of ABC transporter n=1 Tax=Labilithrix luteola TaxID=1391654 RepID=A0A0K1Q2Y3_9BACT|nr:ABC-F family ATP-binding cassette domain-containing protein [Labilithrix luteola]AKU99729.1 ATPase component of ABC transporter [Labilithrix luteola]
MTVLQVADLRFGYAGDTLFEGVTFTLALGEHASLVAPNGAGKSTLLRLLAKEIEPDAGEVVVKKDVTVGYYRQSHEVAAKGDVLSAFLSGFREVVELREELVRAQHDAASGDARALEHLAHVTDRYHVARGDELEHRVAAIAAKLGFSNDDLARPVTSLSGGERGRLHLGVILAQEPDLLMLDEPTNHLDLDTIAWLEGWLKGYRGAVLVVSHDRAFLDAVAPNTMELGTRGLRVYPLPYSAYAEAREEDLARERAILERQQAFVAKTEDFIRKNIAGQKSKQAQSRRKMLDKLERVERPEDVWAVAERIAFRFAPAPRSGEIVLEANGLNARRGGRGLFEGVDLLVRRGERIGIVGPNGAGKSTLLKILAGRGNPDLDGGSVRRGTNLKEGYFDQHLGQVDPKKTAAEEVRSVRGDFTVEAARQYLARFRFWGDDPLRVVAGFSGGERSRLALAKLLLEPKNLLFLDEPTNHLDIPAAEILEEALASFEGTVVLVSHDRRFLETVTTRIVSVRDGKVDVYPGGFSDFVSVQRAREEEARPRKAEPKKPPTAAKAQPTASSEPAAKKGQQHQAQKQASRDREKQQRRVKDLEELIGAGEKQLAELRALLREDPAGNWEKLAKMASEERALARRVDSLVDEWTKLSAVLGA